MCWGNVTFKSSVKQIGVEMSFKFRFIVCCSVQKQYIVAWCVPINPTATNPCWRTRILKPLQSRGWTWGSMHVFFLTTNCQASLTSEILPNGNRLSFKQPRIITGGSMPALAFTTHRFYKKKSSKVLLPKSTKRNYNVNYFRRNPPLRAEMKPTNTVNMNQAKIWKPVSLLSWLNLSPCLQMSWDHAIQSFTN